MQVEVKMAAVYELLTMSMNVWLSNKKQDKPHVRFVKVSKVIWKHQPQKH